MKVRGDFLGPPRSTDKTTLIIKVSKVAKIRNRYNQVPHLNMRLQKIIKFKTRIAKYQQSLYNPCMMLYTPVIISMC